MFEAHSQPLWAFFSSLTLKESYAPSLSTELHDHHQLEIQRLRLCQGLQLLQLAAISPLLPHGLESDEAILTFIRTELHHHHQQENQKLQLCHILKSLQAFAQR